MRTRLALAALVLALMPWLLVDSSSLVARFSSLTEFTLVGLTLIGAGALSDDIDSGEYAIAHGHLMILAARLRESGQDCGSAAGSPSCA